MPRPEPDIVIPVVIRGSRAPYRLMELTIPRLHCPYEPAISPHAEQLEATNLAWLERHHLLSGPAVRRARFGHLAARAYPAASLDGLAIAAAWATWLFLRDDQCDEGGIASRPEAMGAVADHHIAILAGERPRQPDDRLASALVELRDRMFALGGARWMARFLANVQDYFEASVWEADNRARRSVPDLDTYVRLRDLTGAVKTCFDIYELVEGPRVPIDARHDARLASLMRLANRAICWSNDLFSVHKELAHGDVHNLVIVLRHHASLSLPEAVSRAAEMHDEAVHAFAREEHQLLGTRRAAAVQRFVEALKRWVRANLDWSVETGRYAIA